MGTSNPFSDRLREPFNETTRKTRRNLLAASVLGVVIAKVGLIPSKISAFGIDFTAANQQSLVLLLAFAIAYFGLAFIVYLYSELVAWQIVFRSQELEQLKEESHRRRDSLPDEEKWFHDRARFTYIQARPTFFIRIFVELVVPVGFAIYAAISLVTTEPPTQDSANQPVQPTAEAAAPDLAQRAAQSPVILNVEHLLLKPAGFRFGSDPAIA